MSIFAPGRSLIFPARCLCCGEVAPWGEDCCPRCRRRFRFQPEAVTWAGYPLVTVWVCEGQYPAAFRRFKFQGDKQSGRRLALLMARTWEKRDPDFGAQLLTFVPMPPQRQKLRGFNQAELLARWVGKELGLPVVPLLSRTGVLTRHQLPSAFRKRDLDPPLLLPGGEKRAAGKRVLLVDDLVTTGATAAACLEVLESAGAEAAAVLAIARVKGKNPQDG